VEVKEKLKAIEEKLLSNFRYLESFHWYNLKLEMTVEWRSLRMVSKFKRDRKLLSYSLVLLGTLLYSANLVFSSYSLFLNDRLPTSYFSSWFSKF
jgi:hypothetical protein